MRNQSSSPDFKSAQDAFTIRAAELQQAFFEHQAASGRPRGLRWTGCEFAGDPRFAAEGETLTAWWGVTVSFEAIPGGPMEGIPNVSNLRAASAEFVQTAENGWQPVRVHFNLEPAEAITFARENAGRDISELPRGD